MPKNKKSVQAKRILKAGWRSFWRNSWLSAATILVMFLSIFVITGLVFFNVTTQQVLDDLRQKVDISVYFNIETKEIVASELQEQLQSMPEVLTVEYVSREEALAKFKEKHKDNQALLESLQELGDNPLQASLNIKAGTADQYEKVAEFLQNNNDFADDIEKINYQQNREIINRLSAIADMAQKAGLIISLVLASLAILVAFNTIRLTIYTWKDEISVKRLVGATNWNIRGPFVIEGMLYGVAAATLTMIIVFPVIAFLSPKLIDFLPGNDVFAFLKQNFLSLFLFQVIVGIVLGGVSSFIAIRRYLK